MFNRKKKAEAKQAAALQDAQKIADGWQDIYDAAVSCADPALALYNLRGLKDDMSAEYVGRMKDMMDKSFFRLAFEKNSVSKFLQRFTQRNRPLAEKYTALNERIDALEESFFETRFDEMAQSPARAMLLHAQPDLQTQFAQYAAKNPAPAANENGPRNKKPPKSSRPLQF